MKIKAIIIIMIIITMWTREELKQMDRSTRKLTTMHKALHRRTMLTDNMSQEKR